MSTEFKVKYKAETNVTMESIANLLCCGFEGGVGYWCKITGYTKPETVWKWSTPFDDGRHIYRYVQYPLSEGGAVKLQDTEDSEENWVLDLPAIQRGLTVMAEKYPRHWTNFIKEQEDAETGDVFIQCALFGELVYG